MIGKYETVSRFKFAKNAKFWIFWFFKKRNTLICLTQKVAAYSHLGPKSQLLTCTIPSYIQKSNRTQSLLQNIQKLTPIKKLIQVVPLPTNTDQLPRLNLRRRQGRIRRRAGFILLTVLVIFGRVVLRLLCGELRKSGRCESSSRLSRKELLSDGG
jgi:hypothetical protein